MKNVELLSFLETLNLSSLGYLIEANIVRGFPYGGGMCRLILSNGTHPEDDLTLWVVAYRNGTVRYSMYLDYHKGEKPEHMSAALIELCNTWNMKATSCSS